MNLILQDAVAVSLALGAMVLLVRRIVGVVRPSGDKPPACAACPSACAPAEPAHAEPEAVVPVAVLRGGRRLGPPAQRTRAAVDSYQP